MLLSYAWLGARKSKLLLAEKAFCDSTREKHNCLSKAIMDLEEAFLNFEEAFSYPLLFIRPVISSAQTARAGAPGKTHKITTSALSRASRYRAGVESG